MSKNEIQSFNQSQPNRKTADVTEKHNFRRKKRKVATISHQAVEYMLAAGTKEATRRRQVHPKYWWEKRPTMRYVAAAVAEAATA